MKLRNISVSVALALTMLASNAQAQISISVNVGPPPLPIDEQPSVPGDGYIWTPGYWAWDENQGAYYWVDGAWVLAPFSGGLWTPGYWFYSGHDYRWRPGYWSRQVGFYGGINYGHGYGGHGYDGGHWRNGAFNYKKRVTTVDERAVHHVYDARVPQARKPDGVSFSHHRGEAPATPNRPRFSQPAQGQPPTQIRTPQPIQQQAPPPSSRPWRESRPEHHEQHQHQPGAAPPIQRQEQGQTPSPPTRWNAPHEQHDGRPGQRP